MAAKLQFKRGGDEREIACTPLLTIGRTPPNEIVIAHPIISRSHAMIRMLRFETESKNLGKDIVLGPESFKHLPKQLWEEALQRVTIKGKSEPISVSAITFGELDAILSKADEAVTQGGRADV